jgi:hypothetical protein
MIVYLASVFSFSSSTTTQFYLVTDSNALYILWMTTAWIYFLHSKNEVVLTSNYILLVKFLPFKISISLVTPQND